METGYLLASFLLEWLLRLSIFVGSALQLIFVLGKDASYCAFDIGSLEMERTWLVLLAIAQVVSTTLHTVWKVTLVRRAASERLRRSHKQRR